MAFGIQTAGKKTAHAIERSGAKIAHEVRIFSRDFDRNSKVLIGNTIDVLNRIERTFSQEIRGAQLQETTAQFRELIDVCKIELDYTLSDIRQVVRHLNSSLTKLDRIAEQQVIPILQSTYLLINYLGVASARLSDDIHDSALRMQTLMDYIEELLTELTIPAKGMLENAQDMTRTGSALSQTAVDVTHMGAVLFVILGLCLSISLLATSVRMTPLI